MSHYKIVSEMLLFIYLFGWKLIISSEELLGYN